MTPARRVSAVMLSGIERIERAVAFSAFMVLVAVLFSDVLSRELTGAGLPWARDAGVLANLLLTMVGIGIASSEGAHLRPRFADRWLPANWSPVLDVLQDGLMALFCLAFATVAATAVVETAMLGEQLPVLRWPVWPFQLVIPIVFSIAAFRHGLIAMFPELRNRQKRVEQE